MKNDKTQDAAGSSEAAGSEQCIVCQGSGVVTRSPLTGIDSGGAIGYVCYPCKGIGLIPNVTSVPEGATNVQ